MIRLISIMALAAYTFLLSGCGCSREPDRVHTPLERMQDSSYTNKLVKLRDGQAVIAKRIASIKAEIANLGKDAATKAEYSNLTNMLAKCESEARLMQKATQQAVRERLLKNLKEKGDLKK